MNNSDDSKDVSLKGLDEFSKQFLFHKGNVDPDEYITVQSGQTASDEAMANYQKERAEDFIKRAGSFTEDLVAFIIEQKKLRGLSDIETIFGIALANINLRVNYASQQASDPTLTPTQKKDLLEEFDSICWGAQQFYDANQD